MYAGGDGMRADSTETTNWRDVVLAAKKERYPLAKCGDCPLWSRPMVQGYGPGPDEASFVVVGEAPGRVEASSDPKRPFIGKSGQLIRRIIDWVGMDNTEGYFTNTALCHPPDNKIPPRAALCCRERLKAELKPYFDKPDLPILAAGRVAGQIIVNPGHTRSLRGKWFYNGRVLCTWHPAHVLRLPKRFSELAADVRKLSRGEPAHPPEVRYVVAETPGEFGLLVDFLIEYYSGKVVCFDLETDQLIPWEHKILCGAFAYETNKAWVWNPRITYHPDVKRHLERLFDSDVQFVGHNIKFDVRYLRWQLGVNNSRGEHDTLIADYVLDENRMHALKPLLNDYFDIQDYEEQLVKRYLKSKGDFYSKVPPKHLMHYNVLDVCYTLFLWRELERQLRAEDLYERPYLFPLMAAHSPMIDVEMSGIDVDLEKLDWLSGELGERAKQLQVELDQRTGWPINTNSWMQVAKVMYDQFKMPKVRIRGAKPRTTRKEARELIQRQLDPESDAWKWLNALGMLKSINKLRSSYVDNVHKYLDPNGRVHPDNLLYGTESGRISVRDPAIQTIPRSGTGNVLGDVWGKHIRGVYTARPGCKVMEVDISQAEMRVACCLSGDPFLTQVFFDGRDLHDEVAIAMYGPNFEKDQRKLCKMFNFAYLYGGTEHSFNVGEGFTIDIARAFVRNYKAVMGRLTEWKEECMERLEAQGYVETETGRRRRFPLLTTDNYDDARKAAVNTPVQGMASDLVLISFIESYWWLQRSGHCKDVSILALIHDSLLYSVPDEKVDYIAWAMHSIMQGVCESWFPQIPWKVDVDVGPNWGEIKGYDHGQYDPADLGEGVTATKQGSNVRLFHVGGSETDNQG